MSKLNLSDVGCHADSSLGHAHVRAVLADLVRTYCNAPDVVHALNGEMSDDAWEENDALAMLNDDACSHGVYFDFVDGDLLLLKRTDTED